jgi:2-polyprenyl-3-methyl-5-hydroxy-6-metoxy-1,4-benzoquinol methylase
MDRTHLDELISIEQTYWWHMAKQELLLDLLKRECPPPAKILEGGVGSGNNLLTLKKLGYEVSGLDQMQAAVDYCHSIGINDVQLHDLQQPWPTEQKMYDVVILLDVIEHCQHPSQVLCHAERTLCSGGKIIVSVPAIPFLMGPCQFGWLESYLVFILE